MPKLPRITAREMISVLVKIGFTLSRQSGSHRIYINAKKKRVTIPFHGGKVLHPKIIKNILRDADISVAQLKKLL